MFVNWLLAVGGGGAEQGPARPVTSVPAGIEGGGVPLPVTLASRRDWGVTDRAARYATGHCPWLRARRADRHSAAATPERSITVLTAPRR